MPGKRGVEGESAGSEAIIGRYESSRYMPKQRIVGAVHRWASHITLKSILLEKVAM
jgi:hypothetical protein